MTADAEALRKKLDHLTYQGCHVSVDERVDAVARTIVEELGITEEMVRYLKKCGNHPSSAIAFSILLELAGADHGE